MPEKFLRRRHYSNPNTTTTSPLFYSIPWSPLDYSVTGLGPGQSIRSPNFDNGNNGNYTGPQTGGHRCPCESRVDYSKSGFTFYKDTKCTCGFLSGKNLKSAQTNALKTWKCPKFCNYCWWSRIQKAVQRPKVQTVPRIQLKALVVRARIDLQVWPQTSLLFYAHASTKYVRAGL